jgi:hypothetical protein
LDDQLFSSVFFSPSPFFFLIDGPLGDSTCALWTSQQGRAASSSEEVGGDDRVAVPACAHILACRDAYQPATTRFRPDAFAA